MKKQTSQNPKGTLNAKALGIKDLIILDNFKEIILWSKNSIRLTSRNERYFWIYSLKDAKKIFSIVTAPDFKSYSLTKEDTINVERNINKLTSAIADGLERKQLPQANFRALMMELKYSDEEINELILGTIPQRCKSDLCQHVLAYALYCILGKPEDYIGKDLYWRKILQKNA